MASAVSPPSPPDLEPKTPQLSIGTETAIQDKSALEDARLRTVFYDPWKEAGGPWRPHREVWVLMFSWADEWDELQTSPEVDELSDVFENRFKYNVLRRKIERNNSLPQHQVAKELTAFVCEHDQDGSLLIIYYAGHGIATTTPGTLILQGEHPTSPKDLSKNEIMRRNTILWHKVEGNLEHTRADVLTIFDCCFAGNLLIPEERSISPRIFEFLAATGRGQTTPKPGPHSFTKALIWALMKLGNRNKPFSTSELLHQIGNEAPDFPRRNQIPILKERFEASDRRLMLAPIREDISYSVPPPVQKLEGFKDAIDLRFLFDRPPNDEDIKFLSKELKKLIDTKAISPTEIRWLGLASRNIVRAVAMKWVGTVRLKRSNSSLSIPLPLVNSPLNMNDPSLTPTSSGGKNVPIHSLAGITLKSGGTWYHLRCFFYSLTRDVLKSTRGS